MSSEHLDSRIASFLPWMSLQRWFQTDLYRVNATILPVEAKHPFKKQYSSTTGKYNNFNNLFFSNDLDAFPKIE